MTSRDDEPIPSLEPEREPRPQDEDGTYLCYTEGCTREADITTPRRIASTGMDPVETVVTFCLRCHVAWETLGETRQPLSTTAEIETELDEEFGERGWAAARFYPRLLANIVLYDDPRGGDPPAQDSPLGDIFDHAGELGEKLRDELNTPIDEQLREYDSLDVGSDGDMHDEEGRPSSEADLTDFEG